MGLTQEQKQDFFNRAVAGLASQGFKRSLGDLGLCVYRGEGECEGLKCALGWLIPDEKYDYNKMEGGRNFPAVLPAVGLDWYVFEEGFGKVPQGDEAEAMRFFADLQECHDDGAYPASMRSRLNEFGVTYGLAIPAVLLDDA